MTQPQPSATAIFYRNLRWLRFVDRFGRKGSQIVDYVGGLADLIGQSFMACFSRPFYFHDCIEQLESIGWGSLTVVLLTFLTLINLVMFNSKKSGYVSVSIASLAYALILTLANQLEYPYLGPLSVSIDPLFLLLQKYENP